MYLIKVPHTVKKINSFSFVLHQQARGIHAGGRDGGLELLTVAPCLCVHYTHDSWDRFKFNEGSI